MPLLTLVTAYVLGGLTFLPLLAIAGLTYLYFALPVASGSNSDDLDDSVTSISAPVSSADSLGAREKLEKDSKLQEDGSNVAAGYFAVCREYVPGGVNGKPPERSTPAGDVLIAESPSVYQSMYRSIFERGKTQIPSLEGDKKDGRVVKKARNVFYVVLRHTHLMLFDDAEQLEVRHVIPLLHHNVDIYAGGEVLREGDLWVKRNCIRLIRKPSDTGSIPSKPFYIFSDNCSEKEDFYHAMLLSQSSALGHGGPLKPQRFDTAHMIKLVQQLHSSDADPQMRWLNALIGRLFLATHRTEDVEALVRNKIDRKISRVPKPNFITALKLQEIDMGDAAPLFSSPKLKHLDVDGDMTIGLDVRYNGHFKLQIAAVARIDLGTRFTREVDLVLAGVLRRLTGHLLVRIKPPPSNRAWITFETMPQIDLNIEPIVSSRQITYSIILRAIESRIREVIGETLVSPNWDDIPFLDTEDKDQRGGIWAPSESDLVQDLKTEQGKPFSVDAIVSEDTKIARPRTELADVEQADIKMLATLDQKSMSMPSLLEANPSILHRRANSKAPPSPARLASVTSSSVSSTPTASSIPFKEPQTEATAAYKRSPKLRAIRSNSFASATTSLVNVEDARRDGSQQEVTQRRGQRQAIDLMQQVKDRDLLHGPATSSAAEDKSDTLSGTDTLNERSTDMQSHADDDSIDAVEAQKLDSEQTPDGTESAVGIVLQSAAKTSDTLRTDDIGDAPSQARPAFTFPTLAPESRQDVGVKRSSVHLPASSAAKLMNTSATVKKWGWNALQRASVSGPSSTDSDKEEVITTDPETIERSKRNSLNGPHASPGTKASTRGPMGRGQPLPPPGTQLPGPPKSLWATSTLNISSLRRKPIGHRPDLPPRRSDWTGTGQDDAQDDTFDEAPPPSLPPRRQLSSDKSGDIDESKGEGTGGDSDHPEPPTIPASRAASSSAEMLVVAAPEEEEDA